MFRDKQPNKTETDKITRASLVDKEKKRSAEESF